MHSYCICICNYEQNGNLIPPSQNLSKPEGSYKVTAPHRDMSSALSTSTQKYFRQVSVETQNSDYSFHRSLQESHQMTGEHNNTSMHIITKQHAMAKQWKTFLPEVIW